MSSPERKSAGYSPAPPTKEQLDSLLQTLTGESLAPIYVDFTTNRPKSDEAQEEFRQNLRHRFDKDLPGAVERVWELPPLALHRPNDEYLTLLLEARALFVAGYFYSCVAMCGIVGERLVKDVLRVSILIVGAGGATRPTDPVFDQLERIDFSALLNFISEAKLVGDDAKSAGKKLVDLRNQYAHARGKNPIADAKKAIEQLHILVEGTVSVFKDFELKDGRFVLKSGIQLDTNQSPVSPLSSS